MGLFNFLSGRDNRRHIKKLTKLVGIINSLEPKYQAMTDEELRGMTTQFKAELAGGKTLDDILCDAYAVVREAAKRVLGQRHYDVQLMGGIVLHQGRIAEMKTGEGKTLTETLPSYLNALLGKGVHIVSVNEYLAKRDAESMGKVQKFLGLTVGCISTNMDKNAKQFAYRCDITYGTNNEFGFDYLRDNMIVYTNQKMQREHTFCIVDEVDSILIDEARTPLIISGKGGESSTLYKSTNTFVRRLKQSTNVDNEGKPLVEGEEPDGDFEVDYKKKVASLTTNGIIKAEHEFGIEDLTDGDNIEFNHYINNALRANFVMKRDVDYIVKDGEIIIVDEFTGRLMQGRRFNEGLHQAIEAKEFVKIQNENKTMATITFQNYFRLYKKLSGMTGTAKTEENEFKGIYGLDVVVIPPNLPNQRKDETDLIFASEDIKLAAVIRDVAECAERGQPVLIGTANVEKSEKLSKLMRREKIAHNVLNAKNHGKEADIIAQAGRLGAVTLATNMAGRGTDILLGGNAEYLARNKMNSEKIAEEIIEVATSQNEIPDELVFNIPSQERQASGAEINEARARYHELHKEFKVQTDAEKSQVIALGGLRVIGTERHDSRRIDNQLRGRAGRQGDIGSSAFFVSVDDDMIQHFGGEKIRGMVAYLSGDENEPLVSKMLSNVMEGAQKRLEGMNYSRRRNVFEYDNVLNRQREIIYGERNKVLNGESVHDQIIKMIESECAEVFKENVDFTKDSEEWDMVGLNRAIATRLCVVPKGAVYYNKETLAQFTPEELQAKLIEHALGRYDVVAKQAEEVGFNLAEYERNIMLKIIDAQWTEHIDAMHGLRRDVGMMGYGKQDPVMVYKKEGFGMFESMLGRIQTGISAHFTHILEFKPKQKVGERKQVGEELNAAASDGSITQTKATIVKGKKIGRNDACPCGATYEDGTPKKYSNCCGK